MPGRLLLMLRFGAEARVACRRRLGFALEAWVLAGGAWEGLEGVRCEGVVREWRERCFT